MEISIFAAFRAPGEPAVHPIAAGTDPLVLKFFNKHDFFS
jgi:hypothetical protein